MKKFLLSTLAAIAVSTAAYAYEGAAGDLVTTLFKASEETPAFQIKDWNHVDYGTEYFVDASVGNYIYIKIVNAKLKNDDETEFFNSIEIQSNNQRLPGSLYCKLDAETYHYRAYITEDMLNKLKAGGIQIFGNDFYVEEVSIYNDGFAMPAGAIWGGYFWVGKGEWKTLELFEQAFDTYAGQRYLEVKLQEPENELYTLNARTTWNSDGIWAESGVDGQVERHTTFSTIDLQNQGITAANITEKLNSDRLMIQSFPGTTDGEEYNSEKDNGYKGYNITAVVLVNQASGVGDLVVADEDAPIEYFNIQGQRVNGDLTPGLYIRRQGNSVSKIMIK
ncbi:MAG: hypothetical protein ACI31C_02370 [Muribaculaceae bacterium]